LANRLTPLLHKIISPLQGAFVSGRWIAENVILAKEIVHYMNHKQGGSTVVRVKVDLMKAYDRLEWSFLLKVMECLGFSSKWCQLVHQCITMVRFSVLVNGTPFGYIVSSRGIHQGGSLSSYLFILCTEVLSRLLLRKEAEGLLHGVMVRCKCLTVSYLMFVDDLLSF